ncbi:MAG: glucose 1-dehydrogenase [Rhodospirillales bacterium]|jgi:3-oxoacyl-[acyl-carrier protein] reductase|nr:glucose 1-dehydrogenase [Rhodospirillales bacterium]
MKSYLADLAGKAVLVTGSSTGIGAAVAQGFAACGARVAVHYNRSRAAAENVVAEIKKDGGEAILLEGDLSKSVEAKRVIDETVAAFGRIDVLVNNVGGLVRRTMAVDNEDEVVDAIIDLNIRSMVAATRAAIPHFERQGGGNIINTGSVAARHGGGPGTSVYAATKGFVHTVTKSLAKELVGLNVRVNSVSPGAIWTPFHKDTPESAVEQWKKMIPMGRLGTPDDLVGAYLFLASDSMSAYITGQIIDVNGGMVMP